MILVIAAHPDDEVLGCGSTISILSITQPVNLLLLGTGRDHSIAGKNKILDCVKRSADILGIQHFDTLDFPDQKYDTVPLIDITQAIEGVVGRCQPEIIYTHYRNDLNKDHRITHGAVMTACRPQPGAAVKKIYSFEVLSSTEWQYPFSFNPNVYVPINGALRAKTHAMQLYAEETREAPHPRSIQGIVNLARYRGQQVGVEYAEAFELVREVV